MEASASALRGQMVDRLVEQGAVSSGRVEQAFRTVPRHAFLPDVPLEQAYRDEAIVTKRGPDGIPISSSSQPAIMAIMLEQLRVDPGRRVLEVGAGTGYNAALLDVLAGPDGSVTTVDLDEDLVEGARRNLAATGHDGVEVVLGDGWRGWADTAPYDRIEVTVGVWDLSPDWTRQLAHGGLLVAPLWIRGGFQLSVAFSKQASRMVSEDLAFCGFMRMRGPHAGPEGYKNIAGWDVSFEDLRQADEDVLARLLARDPKTEDSPSLPGGWMFRLMLEEPDGIQMSRFPEGSWRWGIFDAGAESLAVIETPTGALLTFGGPEAATTLKDRLARQRPFDLASLEIEAIPSGSADVAPSQSVLRRRDFDFFIRES